MSHAKEIPAPILILIEIKKRRGAKVKELLERLDISTSALYTNLYKLMNEGYIKKEGDRYVITEKGVEYLNTVKNLYKEVVESI